MSTTTTQDTPTPQELLSPHVETPTPHVNAAQYAEMYAASVANPEAFWAEQGKRLDWIKPFTKVKDVDFTLGQVSIKWFEDGVLNVSANCIDRHLETRGDQTAIIWEPDDPNDKALHITYKDLHRSVCKMANILETLGVRKGDRVVIYLPMIPEAAYAMLACARIGAIHSIVSAVITTLASHPLIRAPSASGENPAKT
ncbi:MAG: acetyl-coenzyme A synthetase N-terminal domain-containing protein, partial [Pseudomonadota bacterium]